MKDKSNKIPILVGVKEDVSNMLPTKKGGYISKMVVEVTTKSVTNNLKNFIKAFEATLQELPENCGDYRIDELELSLSIDANGKISLIGEIGSSINTSIKIKLKK